MTDNGTFRPDWTLPPGATILDLLVRRRLETPEFARRLGVTVPETRDLLDGKLPLTQDTARRLEAIFGAPATFWLTREAQYRSDLQRLTAEQTTSKARAWVQGLPVADMVRFGWMTTDRSPASRVTACLDYFGMPDLATWEREYKPILEMAAFRKSQSFESSPAAVAAWVRQGEIVAEKIACKPWSATGFKNELQALRALTRRKAPASFVPELVERCAAFGVAVAIVRAPKGCRASGLTRFLSPTKALLLLSFRHLSDDHFWFTFFHEAGHLILHSNQAAFLEGVGIDTTYEWEADSFAAATLIPPEFEGSLNSVPLTAHALMRFARDVGISPGIVVGQLQHRGRLRRDQMNKLRRRYTWA